MTDLPGYSGDLNRFIIERAEDGENRALFHFVRDDCRFEIAVSKSIRGDGQWVAFPPSPTP